MPPDDLSHYDDLLDDGERALWGIRMAWVILPDGSQGLRWGKDGEDPIKALAVGALESVKLEVFPVAIEEEDGCR